MECQKIKCVLKLYFAKKNCKENLVQMEVGIKRKLTSDSYNKSTANGTKYARQKFKEAMIFTFN